MSLWRRLLALLSRKSAPPATPARPPPPRTADILAALPAGAECERLAALIRIADAAYDEMYETRSPTGSYADMKDSMTDAIALAKQLGLTDAAAELDRVLEHRMQVFRRQMS